MSHPTLQTNLWETVKCDLKGLFPDDVFQMWFEPLRCLDTSEDTVTLGVPNDFAAIWIHDNYLDLITQRMRMTAGRMVQVNLRKSDMNPAASQVRATVVAKPVPKRTIRYDERSAAAGSLN